MNIETMNSETPTGTMKKVLTYCPRCSTVYERNLLSGSKEDREFDADKGYECDRCSLLCVVCDKKPTFPEYEEIKVCEKCYSEGLNYTDSQDNSQGQEDKEVEDEDNEDRHDQDEAMSHHGSDDDYNNFDNDEDSGPLDPNNADVPDNQLDNKASLALCNKIQNICEQAVGGLGFDGHGELVQNGNGSTNGELGPKGCQVFAQKLLTTDVLLDIGHSGGIAAFRMAALSNCHAVIGVECQYQRYILSMINHLSLNECKVEKLNQLKIAFEHSDITKATSIDGVSVVYMYDKVFTPDLIDHVVNLVRSSTTVRLLISTKTHDHEDLKLVDTFEAVRARGGRMGSDFYLYERNPQINLYNESAISVADPQIAKLIERATTTEQRLAECIQVVTSYQKSDHGLRKNSVSAALKEPTGRAKQKQLFDKLLSGDLIYDKRYLSIKHKHHTVYVVENNENVNTIATMRQLEKGANNVEMDAYAETSTDNGDRAILTPCTIADGSADLILVSLHYSEKGPRYFGVIYSGGRFIEKSMQEVLKMGFDYETSGSLTEDYMLQIRLEYREKYPLKNISSKNLLADKRVSVTPNTFTHESMSDGSTKSATSGNKPKKSASKVGQAPSSALRSKDDDTIQKLRDKIKEHEALKKAAADVAKEKDKTIKNLTKQLEAADTDKAGKKRNREETSELNRKIKKLESDIASVTKELSASGNTVNKLQTENSKVKGTVESLQEKVELETKNAKLASKETEKISQEKANADVKYAQDLTDKEREIKESANALLKSREDYNKATEENKKLSTEKENLYKDQIATHKENKQDLLNIFREERTHTLQLAYLLQGGKDIGNLFGSFSSSSSLGCAGQSGANNNVNNNRGDV